MKQTHVELTHKGIFCPPPETILLSHTHCKSCNYSNFQSEREAYLEIHASTYRVYYSKAHYRTRSTLATHAEVSDGGFYCAGPGYGLFEESVIGDAVCEQ